MRGECYVFDNIRQAERDKALPVLRQMKRSEQEWIELVKKGLATVVTELLPCNGKRISYHMI